MQTVKEFLEAYVSQHGSAKVLVNGDYVDLDVPGVEQVMDLPADIYVVKNTGIDSEIAEEVDNVVYAKDGVINTKSNAHPADVMNRSLLQFAQLTDSLIVYTKNGLPCGTTTPEHPKVSETTTPEPINTTIPPEAPDEGVPFSITGGSDDEDVVEEVNDEDEEDDNNDVSRMVW